MIRFTQITLVAGSALVTARVLYDLGFEIGIRNVSVLLFAAIRLFSDVFCLPYAIFSRPSEVFCLLSEVCFVVSTMRLLHKLG
jgi:hypothetical protein